MFRFLGAVRAAALVLCSAGVLLASGALQRADADSSPIAVDYDVFAGGMHVLSSVLEINLEDRSYNARLGAELAGMPGWFADWAAEVQSDGAIQRGELNPAQYSAERVRRGESQKTVLDFAGEGEVGVTFVPERNDSDDLVPAELLAESLDPLSGLISMINTVTEGGECAATIPVFDGRRRYDVVFTDRGLDELRPSSKSSFSGVARRCRMQLEPIAGAIKDDDDDDSFWNSRPENRRRRQLDIWLARPIADGPIIPVRMIGRSSIGAFIIHMRNVQVPVSIADTETPEGCTVVVEC